MLKAKKRTPRTHAGHNYWMKYSSSIKWAIKWKVKEKIMFIQKKKHSLTFLISRTNHCVLSYLVFVLHFMHSKKKKNINKCSESDFYKTTPTRCNNKYCVHVLCYDGYQRKWFSTSCLDPMFSFKLRERECVRMCCIRYIYMVNWWVALIMNMYAKGIEIYKFIFFSSVEQLTLSLLGLK